MLRQLLLNLQSQLWQVSGLHASILLVLYASLYRLRKFASCSRCWPLMHILGSQLPGNLAQVSVNGKSVVTGLEDLSIDDRTDAGIASTSGDDYENAGREPLHPRDSVIDREPLRESQMTVPETPSPDMMAAGKGGGRRRDFLAGRNADNPSPTKARGRAQRNAAAANSHDQVKNSYSTICGTAEKMFNRIRQGLTGHAAPASLKSAFFQPLFSKLAAQMSVDLLACTDDEFMAMFTGDLAHSICASYEHCCCAAAITPCCINHIAALPSEACHPGSHRTQLYCTLASCSAADPDWCLQLLARSLCLRHEGTLWPAELKGSSGARMSFRSWHDVCDRLFNQ